MFRLDLSKSSVLFVTFTVIFSCTPPTETATPAQTSPLPTAASETSSQTATSTTTSTSTSTTQSAGTLAISDIDDLPNLLDPVEISEVGDIEAQEAEVFDSLAIQTELVTLASEGASFGRTVVDLNAAFESANNPSKAMCEITNSTMKFIFEAGSPDFMNCIIKASGISDDPSLYEGDDKFYVFTMNGDEGQQQYRVRINVENGPNGIEAFEFAACSQNSGSWRQDQFLRLTIDEKDFYAVSGQRGPNGSLSRLIVEATLNELGEFVGLKEMDYKSTNVVSETSYLHSLIVQSSRHLLLNEAATHEGGRQLYSFFEFIDKNTANAPYATTKLAIGDGAALIKLNGMDSFVQGWNADSFAINANEQRIAKVEGQESRFLQPLTVANPDFTGDEVYDCDATSAVEVTLDSQITGACIERFEIDQEGSGFCQGLSY